MGHLPLSLAYAAASLWALWVLYVMTMGFYRAQLAGRLKGLPLVLAAPFIIVAFLVDVLVQLTIATVVFRDLPRHWLVTSRLQAYIDTGRGWRHDWAQQVCLHLLDPFDPTEDHCKRVR